MTAKEAAYRLRSAFTICEFKDAYGEPIDSDIYYDALNMAIKALEAQDATYTNVGSTISRQAAIDALEKVAALFPWKVPGNRDSYDRYNEAWNDAIGRAEIEIEELPSAQPESQWIPVSERLPEDKTAYYLATIANRGLFFTTTLNNNVECVRWDYNRRKGKDSWHWCTKRTVIAWMPLPEPYRAERRTNERFD